MSKYEEVYEAISDKILTSLRKNLGDEKVRYSCPKCGFVIPKYKGKYPRHCPLCGDLVDMNKYKLTKAWAQAGLQVDMNPFGDKIEPSDVDFNAKLNQGMITGLGKGMNGDKVKKKCDKCGFIMPKYAGRYPTYCPACGEDMNPNNPVMEDEDLKKNAEKMNVLIEAEEEG
jgi:rubrerythrin